MALFGIGRKKKTVGLDVGSGFIKVAVVDHSGVEPEVERLVVHRLSADAIVEGEQVAVPTETDLQYAVATALVGRAIRAKDKKNTDKVFGNILEYAGRFPQKEMGVMLVSDMHRAVGEKLFEVEQFGQWAQKIADVMLYDM